MKAFLALLSSFLLGMSSLPVPREAAQAASDSNFDLTTFWNMLVQAFQQASVLSGWMRETWLWLISALPPSTVLWLTLAVAFTLIHAGASFVTKVSKPLMIIFWAVFLIVFAQAQLHF